METMSVSIAPAPVKPNTAHEEVNQRSTKHRKSCTACRNSKLKCDRKQPCQRCQKRRIECVATAVKPRKPASQSYSELRQRLRKLEEVAQNLSEHINGDQTHTRASEARCELSYGSQQIYSEDTGHLAIRSGRCRYVSGRLWGNMGDEIAEMRDILDRSLLGVEDTTSLDSESMVSVPSSSTGLLFHYNPTAVSVETLHPSPAVVGVLWQIFKDNVDPLVKVSHRPSTEELLLKASSAISSTSKSEQALVFAIYLAAVNSIDRAQCQSVLEEPKEDLISRFRFATEQSLVQAGLLTTSSLMTLQAFVLYLTSLRSLEDSRLVWSLSSLALHLAQTLGVHRDGTNFGLSPFETEIRRRTWWNIFATLVRLAEDQGSDATFPESTDTQMPLNLSDDDLFPDMTNWPQPLETCTEMTVSLIRFELMAAIQSLISPKLAKDCSSPEETIRVKEAIISGCYERLEQKYLRHCNTNIPLFWLSVTMSRLTFAKMWIMSHSSFSRTKQDNVSSTLRTKLFTTSSEILETFHVLFKNDSTARWRWLFKNYMQWPALVFVLSELCVRPISEEYDRAWRTARHVYNDLVGQRAEDHKHVFWKPVRELMAIATRHRNELRGDSESSTVDQQSAQYVQELLTLDQPLAASSTSPLMVQNSPDGPGPGYLQCSGPKTHPSLIEGAENFEDILSQQLKWTDNDIPPWMVNEHFMQQSVDLLNWPDLGIKDGDMSGDFFTTPSWQQ